LKENFGGNGTVSRRLSMIPKLKNKQVGKNLKKKKQAISVEK